MNRISDCPPIHKSRTYYPRLFIIQEASIPLECRLMKAWPLHDPALEAALIGMAGLATAMGIGRFAFTPMLPLMQLHDLVSLRQGSYLASANYVGYLLGALLLFAFNPAPSRAAKFGLAAVAASTLAMAFTSSFWPWLVLRLIAGIASAFVLVGVSGWALAVLAAHDRPGWTGCVFAGVGRRHSVCRRSCACCWCRRPCAGGRLDCPWCCGLLRSFSRGAFDREHGAFDGR